VEQDIPEICAPCLRQELNMSLNWWVPCCEGLSWYLPSLVLAGGPSFGLSLAFPRVFSVMIPAMGFDWIFCFPFGINLAIIN
jgi:hypothetical protein